MAKRTETKTAILIQVMDELGFDREIIAKVSKVPQRTVSDIVNWKGYWGATPKVNELRGESLQALSAKVHPRRCHGPWRCGVEAIRGVVKRRGLCDRFEYRLCRDDASIKI
jgi:hypothetical protein